MKKHQRQILNEGGRPTISTPSVVLKLVMAFNNGYNISEACQYAGIGRRTFYTWLEKNTWFKHKMEEAQGAPNRKAKEIIVQAINGGSVQDAWRWLERRDPDFVPKSETDINHGLQETREKIKAFLDDSDPKRQLQLEPGSDDQVEESTPDIPNS